MSLKMNIVHNAVFLEEEDIESGFGPIFLPYAFTYTSKIFKYHSLNYDYYIHYRGP